MATYQTLTMTGWAETPSEGIATIYLCAIDEGMITSPTDTPANTQFRPRILNAEQFSIKRQPPVWPQASTQGVQAAAFGQLQIDNYDGAFDFLLRVDLRDSTVIFQLPLAGALLTGTTMANAPVLATAILDTVTMDNEDVITVSLKDTIARLDKVLPARYNPPFADPNAAGKMVQMSFGPFRNRALQLIDSVNKYFVVHDAPWTSITRVTDMAAPLDPTATPAQWSPALNNSGIQLNTMPVGKLTCEGCVTGQQGTAPGGLTAPYPDVLNGSGAFAGTNGATTFAASPWLGRAGYGTTSTGAPTGTGPYTIPVTNTGAIPANGTQVYISDGTNKLLGTVTAGSTTTSIIVTRTDSVGTVTSIANGSPLVQTGAPTGWKYTLGVLGGNDGIGEFISPPYPFGGVSAPNGPNGARVLTSSVWYPGTSPAYGSQLSYETAVLQPGNSYRISFGLYGVDVCNIPEPSSFVGGFLVTTALSTIAADYIAGFNNPIGFSATSNSPKRYTFEFTVPTGGSARKLYFIISATPGNLGNNAKNSAFGAVFDVKVEQLGQYIAQPLSAISMTDYFKEILVERAGEASTIFNSADTDALAIHPISNSDPVKDGSLVPFSCCFDNPINILDALRMALDNFCATLFTDNLGALRSRRLSDPSNPTGRVIKADFIGGLANGGNVNRPMAVYEDPAAYLTTLYGSTRNWYVYQPSDFVTDQNIVTQNIKAMFSRLSQYNIKASKSPANAYSFAISAPQFDTTFDVPGDCQLEADRVTGIWSPNVYSDGTVFNGKRRIVVFTVDYDDPTAVGYTIQTAVTNLMFGDFVTLTNTVHGFNNTPAVILGWEIFPFSTQLGLTVMV
jgi:hypothetical protein